MKQRMIKSRDPMIQKSYGRELSIHTRIVESKKLYRRSRERQALNGHC